MRNSHDATIHPLERRGAVILPYMDGNVSRHVAEMRQRGQSENTITGRQDVLRLLAKHAGKPLIDITEHDMQAWQATLGILAQNSRYTYVSHVRTYYQWLLKTGVTTADPSAALVMPRHKRGLPRPMPEAHMVRALTQGPVMLRLWVALAGYEGCRACEISRLDRTDVQDAVTEPYLWLHGKGDVDRVVPLVGPVGALLDEYGMPTRGALFRRVSGRRMTARDVSTRANAYLHRLGIPETLHQLRHRFATIALDEIGDVRLVQELLGHASPATTAVYTLVSTRKAAAAMERVARPRLHAVPDDHQETGS